MRKLLSLKIIFDLKMYFSRNKPRRKFDRKRSNRVFLESSTVKAYQVKIDPYAEATLTDVRSRSEIEVKKSRI